MGAHGLRVEQLTLDELLLDLPQRPLGCAKSLARGKVHADVEPVGNVNLGVDRVVLRGIDGDSGESQPTKPQLLELDTMRRPGGLQLVDPGVCFALHPAVVSVLPGHRLDRGGIERQLARRALG